MICIYLVPIKEMIADNLIKVFLSAKHKVFVKMTSLKDQEKHLAFFKKKKNLKNVVQQCLAESEISKVYGYSTDAPWYIQRWSVRDFLS